MLRYEVFVLFNANASSFSPQKSYESVLEVKKIETVSLKMYLTLLETV